MQNAFEKSNTCWYALRTKPRWEKLVLQQLEKNDIDAFCPFVKKQNQWKDRKKWIET
ncbi:MAG: transcription termination/antitermination NusG family protein, partial [Chitinophagaceae bacterium]